jgi:signal peptidase I
MRALRDLLQLLVKLATFVGLVAIVLRVFFVDVIVMPHNGMAPTLVYGDRLLVWRRATPDLGDIVLCEHPRRPEASVIGRALAFAGHIVSTDSRGQVFVDDNRASVEGGGTVRFYDVLREKMFTMQLASIDYHGKHRHEFFVEDGSGFGLGTFAVEHGMYLLGDNRSDTYNDSREIGEVDPAHCHGEIFMRLTPAPHTQPDDINHGYFDYVH